MKNIDPQTQTELKIIGCVIVALIIVSILIWNL